MLTTKQQLGWKQVSTRSCTEKQAGTIVHLFIANGFGDLFPECRRFRTTKQGTKVLVNETRLRAERWLRNNLTSGQASRVIGALYEQCYAEAEVLLRTFGYSPADVIKA